MTVATLITIPEAERIERRHRLGFIDLMKLQGQPIPDRKWLIEHLVPMRNVTLLSGNGGLGKSTILVQLMTSASMGLPWLGFNPLKVTTLGFFAEDDKDELHRRLADCAAHLGLDFSKLSSVHAADRVGQNNELMVFDNSERGTVTSFYNEVMEEACDLGAKLLVLDSTHDLFPGNENSRHQVRQFVGALRQLALKMDGAVVLAGHPSQYGIQRGNGLSGSTAWHNTVRSRLYLENKSNDDPNIRTLSIKKSNYGPSALDIRLRWERGIFVNSSTNPATDRDAGAEEAFLVCLRLAKAQGRLASAGKTSTYYAPKLFMRMPAGQHLTLPRLEHAMEGLFARGVIHEGSVHGPDRKLRKAILEGNAP